MCARGADRLVWIVERCRFKVLACRSALASQWRGDDLACSCRLVLFAFVDICFVCGGYHGV